MRKLNQLLEVVERVVFILSMLFTAYAVYYAIFVAHLWIDKI